jgi:hypothetical protein
MLAEKLESFFPFLRTHLIAKITPDAGAPENNITSNS